MPTDTANAKKPADSNRNLKLSTKVNRAEQDAVFAAAAEDGVTRSALVRKFVLDGLRRRALHRATPENQLCGACGQTGGRHLSSCPVGGEPDQQERRKLCPDCQQHVPESWLGQPHKTAVGGPCGL